MLLSCKEIKSQIIISRGLNSGHTYTNTYIAAKFSNLISKHFQLKLNGVLVIHMMTLRRKEVKTDM